MIAYICYYDSMEMTKANVNANVMFSTDTVGPWASYYGVRTLTKAFLIFGPLTSVQNFIKMEQNCDLNSADRQTARQKDSSDLIIRPIYSNGTDNEILTSQL